MGSVDDGLRIKMGNNKTTPYSTLMSLFGLVVVVPLLLPLSSNAASIRDWNWDAQLVPENKPFSFSPDFKEAPTKIQEGNVRKKRLYLGRNRSDQKRSLPLFDFNFDKIDKQTIISSIQKRQNSLVQDQSEQQKETTKKPEDKAVQDSSIQESPRTNVDVRHQGTAKDKPEIETSGPYDKYTTASPHVSALPQFGYMPVYHANPGYHPNLPGYPGQHHPPPYLPTPYAAGRPVQGTIRPILRPIQETKHYSYITTQNPIIEVVKKSEKLQIANFGNPQPSEIKSMKKNEKLRIVKPPRIEKVRIVKPPRIIKPAAAVEITKAEPPQPEPQPQPQPQPKPEPQPQSQSPHRMKSMADEILGAFKNKPVATDANKRPTPFVFEAMKLPKPELKIQPQPQEQKIKQIAKNSPAPLIVKLESVETSSATPPLFVFDAFTKPKEEMKIQPKISNQEKEKIDKIDTASSEVVNSEKKSEEELL